MTEFFSRTENIKFNIKIYVTINVHLYINIHIPLIKPKFSKNILHYIND